MESDIAWANDNQTVLYVEKDPETLLGLRGQEAPRSDRIRADPPVFHRMT